jgi:hypothetical protein
MSMGKELFKIPDDVSKLAKEQYNISRTEMGHSFFESIKRILDKKEIA